MTPRQRAARTLLQLVAGGALTELVAQLVRGLSPGAVATLMAVWTVVVSYAQNQLEASGLITPIFGARHDEGA